jgi:hypothetical protein
VVTHDCRYHILMHKIRSRTQFFFVESFLPSDTSLHKNSNYAIDLKLIANLVRHIARDVISNHYFYMREITQHMIFFRKY